MDPVSVYSYTDFRKYLSAWHAQVQEDDPDFSKSEFSRRLGLPRTRSYFTDVLAGRKVGASFVDRFIGVLGLEREEARYFRAMVRFNQAQTPEDRELAFDQLVGLSRVHPARLDPNAWAYYRHWWNGAIRALLATGDFDGESAPFVRAIKPDLTAGQVQESLRLLLELGLIRRDPDGFLRQTERLLSTEERSRDEMVKQLQIQQMGVVQTALLSGDDPDRRVFTNTVAISAEGTELVLERVESLRRALRSIVHQDSGPQDRVLQIAVSLVPLARKVSR
jgi:uncharacterized protein (TIGR02147 family)